MRFLLRLLAFLGHLTLVFVALAALAAEGSPGAGLVVVVVIGFAVINSRLLFPWPERRHEMRKTLFLARSSLWVSLTAGLVLGGVGLSGVDPLEDWWGIFALLAGTSALNLLALRVHLGQTADPLSSAGRLPHTPRR